MPFPSSFLRIWLLVLVSIMISLFSATLFVICVGEYINVICFEHSKDVKMCTVKFFFLTPLSQPQDSFPKRPSMLPLFNVFLDRHNRYKQAYIYRFCLSTHIHFFPQDWQSISIRYTLPSSQQCILEVFPNQNITNAFILSVIPT